MVNYNTVHVRVSYLLNKFYTRSCDYIQLDGSHVGFCQYGGSIGLT